jgi:predicted DNA-binding protein
MERLNLNIPAEARARLRRIAQAASRTESEVARDLLLSGIAQSERDTFYLEVSRNLTDRQRQRQIEMLDAFESLDG